VYELIQYDVHKQWLEEFDREAAIRRNLPRRRRRQEGRRWRLALAFRRTRPAVAKPTAGAGAGGFAQAAQCS
jgi:hypothetical protein